MHKNKKASSKMISTYCTTWSRTYHQTLLVFHTHSVTITVSYLVLLGIQSALSILGFPTGRDSATFWDKGTEVPSLSRDKGTTGQAQNLATEWTGTGF